MNNSVKNIFYLAGGIAAGYVVGILTAPKSGKKTREDIGDEINNLKSKVQDISSEVASKISSEVNSVKKTASDIEKQVKSN